MEIDKTSNVMSKEEFKALFKTIGIQKGMVVMVQANLMKITNIIGGNQAFIEALIEFIGYNGTILMPTFTTYMQDPSQSAMQIEYHQYAKAREQALAFNRKVSMPAHDEMAKQFLCNEGVLRSHHPLYSFAVWGKYAKLFSNKHPLHLGLGDDSPLAKLIEFKGYTLMLGVEYQECVMFHHAAYTINQAPICIKSAPIEQELKMEWYNMLDVIHQNEKFKDIGEALEDRYIVKTSEIESCKCRLFSAKEASTIASQVLQTL